MPIIPAEWQRSRFLPPSSSPTCVPHAEGPTVHESAARLVDGRVIYVATSGHTIIQGYAPSLRAFFNDGSVSGVTTIFAAQLWARATVFTAAGGLYLLVCWSIGPSGANTGETLCYRSPSGLGGDWVLRGTLQTFAWGNVEFGNRNNDAAVMGVPEVLPSGRWVVSGPWWTNSNLVKARGMRLAAFTSDDQGATWTVRLVVGYYLAGGTYGYGYGRNIARAPSGRLWWSSTGNVELDRDAYSDDDGTTWTVVEHTLGDAASNRGLSDGSSVFDFRANGTVYQVTDPATDMAGSLIRDYALGGGPYFSLVQDLGGWGYISSHGRCLRHRFEVPPLRGQQRDDIRSRQRGSQQLSGRGGWANAYL